MANTKAQSAVEYLTVYGWALVALLIVLSALYMTGILSVQSNLPRECVFQPGFVCTDFRISGTASSVRMNLTNSLGFAINITNVNATSQNQETASGAFQGSGANLPVVVASGASQEILLNFNAHFANGTFYKFKLNLSYVNCETASNLTACAGGTPSKHAISGYVSGAVES